jgi:hypothetical protein
MAQNVNSFTETVKTLTQNVNVALQSMVQMNNSMTTQSDFVVISVVGTDPITGDASTFTYHIPSFNSLLTQMNRVVNTVDTFVSGNGVVLLKDGTYRQVTTIPVAKSPVAITTLAAPTTFQTRTNWFFENMMFPELIVEFDLKGLIDDRSDRVTVRRVLFDNPDAEATQWFKDNFLGVTRDYQETIDFLNVNAKTYFIDDEVLNLPLNPTQYTGSFLITNRQVINNVEWFYLDTLNYGLTSDGTVVKNIQLKINDQLRYADSLYVVNSIDVTEKRVQLTATVGFGKPSINGSFNIYSTPFATKLVDIPVGYDECDIIFFKGVNDDFNIIADDWGNSVNFYTNDLVLVDSTVTFQQYYNSFVQDFGRQLEGQAREGFIPAFFGVNPDAPVFAATNFNVTQINTQLNAAIDVASVKQTQAQIESLKTIINSLKNTISNQKSELVQLTSSSERADLQSKINSNIISLSNNTVQYQSLVRSLATIAYENNSVAVSPKYRIRGFFDIPSPKPIELGNSPQTQQIIQFETAYRYLRLDNTGNPLNTITYADPSTGQNISGVFSDWTLNLGPVLQKTFDTSTNKYIWKPETIANGDVVNINQLDVPIQKGENVQIKIRSISEAGWPLNPLKSDWSQPVTVTFPANLSGTDQVANILTEAASEEAAIQLDQTLSSAGIYTHMDDSIPNPASGSGSYFKHQAQFLEYTVSTKDQTGKITKQNSVDIQSTIDNLPNNAYVTLTKPTGATSPQPNITGTLQLFFQAIVNMDPSIYDEFDTLIV